MIDRLSPIPSMHVRRSSVLTPRAGWERTSCNISISLLLVPLNAVACTMQQQARIKLGFFSGCRSAQPLRQRFSSRQGKARQLSLDWRERSTERVTGGRSVWAKAQGDCAALVTSVSLRHSLRLSERGLEAVIHCSSTLRILIPTAAVASSTGTRGAKSVTSQPLV